MKPTPVSVRPDTASPVIAWTPRRNRDERDGRKRVLRITEEGSRTVAAAAPYVRRLGQRLLTQFDEEERAQFLEYLRRVGDQANRG